MSDMIAVNCRAGKTLSCLLVAAIHAVGFVANAAQTLYWVGESGGTFSSSENWNTMPDGTGDSAAPAAGDSLFVTGSQTNPFATDTTGLLGIIDLGGNEQTFTAGINNVLTSNGTLKNGTYNLTGTWSKYSYSYTLGAGAVVNLSGAIVQGNENNKTSYSFVLTVKDGAVLNVTGSSIIGRYKNNSGTITIDGTGSKVTVPGLLVGRDTGGRGNLYLRNGGSFVSTGTVTTSGNSTGDNAAQGRIEVTNGSFMSVVGGIGYNATTRNGTPSTVLTVSGNSTLLTKHIYRSGNKRGTLNVSFNDGVFAPNTANVNIFSTNGVAFSSYHITGGVLTVSNTVGKVTIDSVVDGVGGFTLKGGKDLEFTAAPTYTGKTTVEEGTLTYTGTTTTGLVVKAGATFAYTKDIASLKGIQLESGGTLEIPVSADGDAPSAKKLTVKGAVDVDGVALTPVGLDVWTDIEVAVMTATSFTGTPVVPEGLVSVVKSNGNGTETLYIRDANFTPEEEKPYYAVYTGAGDDPTDLTDSANWTCYNAEGVVTPGKSPLYYTTVLLAGSTSLNYSTETASSLPVLGAVVTNNVTLAANCDWTGFGTITIPEGLTIALGGKALAADISAASAGKITGSGTLAVNVASGTYDTSSILAEATCGFRKSGAGTLVVHSTVENKLSNRALALNAGTVRIVNDTGIALTNAFAQGTTGIAGTLDLGGSVQTFSGDPDSVFNNGAVVSNGILKLTSTEAWGAGSKTVTFGAGLSATCSAQVNDWDAGGSASPTLNFINGCTFVFDKTGVTHRPGSWRDSSHHFKLNVLNGSSLEFKSTLYLGGGNNGTATLTVDNSRFIGTYVGIGSRLSSNYCGDGILNVQNGSEFTCVDMTLGTSGYSGASANVTFANSKLFANRIVRSGTVWHTLSMNNLVYVPKSSGKNLFESLGTIPCITGGTLTISNTVGDVTIGSTLGGTGAFKLTGGKRLDFTAAPTYTDATTIEDGTLSFGTLSHGSKTLTMGAKGVLAADVSDATWTTINFNEGSQVLRTTRDLIELAASTISGIPAVPERYFARLSQGDTDTLSIGYGRGLIVIVQ